MRILKKGIEHAVFCVKPIQHLRHTVPAVVRGCGGRGLGCTHDVRPFGVRLGRAQRVAVLGHVQNVGAQFGGHDQEGRRGTTPVAARTAKDGGCKVC